MPVEFPYVVLLDTLTRAKSEGPMSRGDSGLGELLEWEKLGFYTVGDYTGVATPEGWEGIAQETNREVGAFWTTREGYTSPGVCIDIPTFEGTPESSISLWVGFQPSTKSGYRFTLENLGLDEVSIRLQKIEGTIKKFGEAESFTGGAPTYYKTRTIGSNKVIGTLENPVGPGCKFGLSYESGKIYCWVKWRKLEPEEEPPWEVYIEAEDETYTEGEIGFGGNGKGWKAKNIYAGQNSEEPSSKYATGVLPYRYFIDSFQRNNKSVKTEKPISNAYNEGGTKEIAASVWKLPAWFVTGGECSKANGFKTTTGPEGAEYGAYYFRPFRAPAISLKVEKFPGKIPRKSYVNLWCNIQNPAATIPLGYSAEFSYAKGSNTYQIGLYRNVETSGKAEGILLNEAGKYPFEMTNGIGIAFTVKEGLLTGWINYGTGWIAQTEAVDPDWAAGKGYISGYMAFGTNATGYLRNVEIGQGLEGLPPRSQMGATWISLGRSLP